MAKKRIIILGAGISGLSLAWYLSLQDKDQEIVLIEKQEAPGGLMQTVEDSRFLFEKGARIFKTSTSKELLSLALDIGMEKDLISSPSDAHCKYIFQKGKMIKVPSTIFSFFASQVTRPLLRSLCSEWKKPASIHKDESIYAFIARRFHPEVAERLFDPLTVGIYAGDIRSLSIRSCFPSLKKWEEEYGSITKGFIAARKNRKKEELLFPHHSLFSFKRGISSFLHKLAERFPIEYSQEVQKISFANDCISVYGSDRRWEADALFFATPSYVSAHLLRDHVPDVAESLLQIPYASLTVVNVGFDREVLPFKAFGYLIPYGDEVLGTIFDSQVFPQQNRSVEETRLTMMLRHQSTSDKDIQKMVRKLLEKHVQIQKEPSSMHITEAKRCLPQQVVGHEERIGALLSTMQRQLPGCFLAGNYLFGVSVNDCIRRSKQVAGQWASIL